MKLSKEECEIKVLKHLVTSPQAIEKAKALGISKEHFDHTDEGSELKITRSMFELIMNYHKQSADRFVTELVLENTLVANHIKDKVRGKALVMWTKIQEADYDPNDLYSLLDDMRSKLGIRLWHDAIESSKQTLLERGFQASTQELRKNLMEIEMKMMYQKNGIELMTYSDMGEYAELHPVHWHVHNYILAQGLHYLVSAPGCSKTWVLLDLAKASLTGGKWLGRFPVSEPVNVLYIDEEMGCTRIYERLEKMGLNKAPGFYYTNRQGVKIDNDATLDWILNIIKEKNIKLVCIDSLVRIHESDENSNSEMRGLYENLKPIMAAGATVVINHHKPKNGTGMRGAGDLDGQNDGSFEITKGDGCYRIKQSKFRHISEEDGLDIEYRIEDSPDRTQVSIVSMSPAIVEQVKLASLKNRVMNAIREQPDMTQSDIVRSVGARKEDVIVCIEELAKDGDITITPGLRNTKKHKVSCSELAVPLEMGTREQLESVIF